jgi:lysophospholipase L1-like esterase
MTAGRPTPWVGPWREAGGARHPRAPAGSWPGQIRAPLEGVLRAGVARVRVRSGGPVPRGERRAGSDRSRWQALLLPPARSRSWLRRAAGAGAGTLGLLGAVLGAEVMVARRRAYIPETSYDRVLRFPGPADGSGAQALTLAVLGDSTTTGVGTERVEETYAAIVGLRLAERGPVEVHVLGRASARIADVLGAQVPLAEALRPDLILLVAGANDITHVTPFRQLRRDMVAILDRLAPAPLVLAGIPAIDLATVLLHPLRDLGAWRGRRLNRILRHLARDRKHVSFVSLEVRPSHETAEQWRDYLAHDRFHPSAVGYARWALEFAPVLLAADPRRPEETPAAERTVSLVEPPPDALSELRPALRRR